MNILFSVTSLIILVNFLVSYKGFKDIEFLSRNTFSVDSILLYKDYKRFITSGFVHAGWMHLIFNMLALFFFGFALESQVGIFPFAIIYLGGLIGGDSLSLLIHKHDGGYSSIGASGAVMAVIFSSIALNPGMSVGLLFIPIPGWLFGLLYVVLSIYGIRSRAGSMGHDAHLGGGLTGMLLSLIMFPMALMSDLPTILIVALPAITFILLIIYKPEILILDSLFGRKKPLTVEDKYNLGKKQKQLELDRLLEKIHKEGMKSLSKKERERLEEYSR